VVGGGWCKPIIVLSFGFGFKEAHTDILMISFYILFTHSSKFAKTNQNLHFFGFYSNACFIIKLCLKRIAVHNQFKKIFLSMKPTDTGEFP
jgi:hypothetical protein